jgi:hypothetical protein
MPTSRVPVASLVVSAAALGHIIYATHKSKTWLWLGGIILAGIGAGFLDMTLMATGAAAAPPVRT